VATAATLGHSIAGRAADSLAVALAFGLVLAALVSALGHASGAHFNPAVTLGLAATGKFPGRYVPVYLAAQLAGAVLAALAVWALFGAEGRVEAALGAPAPANGATTGRVFLAELLITFLLVFVVIAVATDGRAPAQSAGLAVGFALAAAVLIGGPISGGAANPARALGPMLVAGTFTAAWAYVLAPIVGGVLAAVLYDRFVKQADKPTE
jgi:MIP family channel proteins